MAVSLWNEKDPILKERFFGLTGNQGNHGEDVKELYYFLDATPTHSYLKMLYKYPQAAYPYEELLEENSRRGKKDPEYEIQDTGIFNEQKYFDVFIEYAKASAEDILMKITVFNRGPEAAPLHVLPNIWFRNTWELGIFRLKNLHWKDLPMTAFSFSTPRPGKTHSAMQMIPASCFFVIMKRNCEKCYSIPIKKTAITKTVSMIISLHGANTVNPGQSGTKAAFHFNKISCSRQIRNFPITDVIRNASEKPFDDFDLVFTKRIQEADTFYADLQTNLPNDELKNIQRQAYAGMIWCKQFYDFNVEQWLEGDPAWPPPPAPQRKKGRNHEWRHLNNSDIISMPDSWEYPWFAAWDLAFHCICFADIDPGFFQNNSLHCSPMNGICIPMDSCLLMNGHFQM